MISTTYFYNHFGTVIKGDVVHTTYDSANVQVPVKPDHVMSPDSHEAQVQHSLYHGMDRFFASLKYISFFMLPFYAWVFRLLFRRQRDLYVDHLVFTFHMQSFAYLLISVTILLPFLFPDSIALIRRLTILAIAIYMALALRNLYHKSWLHTILKTVLATFIMVFSMGLIMGLFMLVTLIIDMNMIS